MANAVFLHFAYIRYFWVLMALAATTGLVGRKAADEAEAEAERTAGALASTP